MRNIFHWRWRPVSAGQAAGIHCARSESCVGTATQHGSCGWGLLAKVRIRKVPRLRRSERITRKQEVGPARRDAGFNVPFADNLLGIQRATSAARTFYSQVDVRRSYSSRSAAIASTLVARRAGIHAAAKAAASSTAIAPTSVAGSFGPIPNTAVAKT